MWRDRRLTWARGDRPEPAASPRCSATPGWASTATLGRAARRGSRPTTTSRCTSTTATSTSRACSARPRRGPRRSTSTTATWPRSSATCSPTAGRAASSTTAPSPPTLAEVLPSLPDIALLLQVDDGSGAAAAAGRDRPTRTPWPPPTPRRAPRGCRPDDLYILYTGGTTGMPKGVLWRQADFLAACLGRRPAPPSELVDGRPAHRASAPCRPRRSCTAPPTGTRFSTWIGGGHRRHPGRPRPLRPRRRAGHGRARSGSRRC